MKKHITALGLALALGIGASVAAEPVTLDSLKAKLTQAQRESLDKLAIYNEARLNPAFYQTLKGNNWTFEGITIPESYIAAVAFAQNDYDAISAVDAAKLLDTPKFKTWVARQAASKSDTLATYDWIQSVRLAALAAQVPTTAEKVEFLDSFAAQVLAAAKARGN